MINQNVYIEMNKLIDNINSQKSSGYIPNGIKTNGKSYHHSRDSAFVICSLIELVKSGTYKVNKIMGILLSYLYFEKKVYNNVTVDNLPPDIINMNGKPYLNRSNSKQYDVMALRILTFLQIYELFVSHNMGEIVENVIFDSGMLEYYTKLLSEIYNIPCYDIWGKVYGIHYCNVKLYEMALNSSIKYMEKFTDKNCGMKIKASLVEIRTLLRAFEVQVTINYEQIDVIVPTLKSKYNENTLQYELNSSIFIPYLPMFDYSNQSMDNAKLINSAVVIFSNNDDSFTNITNNKRIVTHIPFISRYGYIVKENDLCCVVSTLATYYTLINMNNDIKENTIFKMWKSGSYNSIRSRSFDRMVKLYSRLKIKMGAIIDKSNENIINNDHENMIRSMYSCVMNDLEINNGYIKNNKTTALKDFAESLIGGNKMISFTLSGLNDMDKNNKNGTDGIEKDSGSDNDSEIVKNKNALTNVHRNGDPRKSGIGILFNMGGLPFKKEEDKKVVKKPKNNVKKYTFKKGVYCDCKNKKKISHKIENDLESKIESKERKKDKESKESKLSHKNEEEFELIDAPDDVSIECLIDIAEKFYCFDCKKKKRVKLAEGFKDINVENFVKVHDPLVKLTKLRGLNDVKDVLLDNIIYFMMRGKKKGKELLHVCIMGPPGVGKTVLAGIISEIYGNLGILSKGHLVKATRTDLIGKYVGHTSAKTREVIKSAEGGILFIDEVYSLVDREGRDSFSKACVDTLTQYLTSKCEDMLCIIAGYKKDIEDYFFKSNKGLERRFAFKFHIDGYKYDELYEIFCDKMKNDQWDINYEDDSLKNIFQDKYKLFKNFGGDVENLVHRYNLVFNRKNFFNKDKLRKVNPEVLKMAIDHLFTEKDKDEPWRTIYT